MRPKWFSSECAQRDGQHSPAVACSVSERRFLTFLYGKIKFSPHASQTIIKTDVKLNEPRGISLLSSLSILVQGLAALRPATSFNFKRGGVGVNMDSLSNMQLTHKMWTFSIGGEVLEQPQHTLLDGSCAQQKIKIIWNRPISGRLNCKPTVHTKASAVFRQGAGAYRKTHERCCGCLWLEMNVMSSVNVLPLLITVKEHECGAVKLYLESFWTLV